MGWTRPCCIPGLFSFVFFLKGSPTHRNARCSVCMYLEVDNVSLNSVTLDNAHSCGLQWPSPICSNSIYIPQPHLHLSPSLALTASLPVVNPNTAAHCHPRQEKKPSPKQSSLSPPPSRSLSTTQSPSLLGSSKSSASPDIESRSL